MSETKVDMYYSLRALFLISTTITAVASRYAIRIVHIIRTTISCLDVCWKFTTTCSPVETHRPADLTICYWGVSTIYPVCNASPTSLSWLTWQCHSYACWALKTKPSRSDSTVTITVVRSILFHNTQLLALIVIKIWENWSSALEEVQTVIDSRSKHEFLAKKGLGRVGRSTFLLGANQRLSGEGVFNGIYYCPLGFRAPCTCIPLCMRLVIVIFWLRASILSIVNSCWHALLSLLPLLEHRAALWS